MSRPILETKELRVAYGGIVALRDVSISIEEGSIVALIGANGAGKTTLLNAISGVVPAQAGSVTHRGTDITRMKSHEIARRRVAHVPEGRKIFAGLSIEDNLRAGAFTSYRDKKLVQERLEANFELFPILADRRKQLGGTLSGGEQQMLAIARGLMSEPEILMLDEPSMGIAPIVVERIFDFILRINKMGKTIFLVEQNARIALATASYAYVLETGAVVKSGAARDLLNDDAVQRIYLGF